MPIEKEIKIKAEKEATDILIGVGLMYNKTEMIDDDKIKKLVGGFEKEFYERATKFGDRAWKVYGKKKNLIVWDCGNGWYQIVKEFKKRVN